MVISFYLNFLNPSGLKFSWLVLLACLPLSPLSVELSDGFSSESSQSLVGNCHQRSSGRECSFMWIFRILGQNFVNSGKYYSEDTHEHFGYEVYKLITCFHRELFYILRYKNRIKWLNIFKSHTEFTGCLIL